MSEILFSNEIMQCINMASNVTKAGIIDCIITDDDKIIFIVKKGQLGLAIGNKAKNLERLRNIFKKTIKFVEFDDNPQAFVTNLFKPYTLKNLTFEGEGDNVVAKVEVEHSDKSKIIGKGGRNINVIRQIAKRHHNIKDVQIK